MPAIRQLPDLIANQIAAGEVVERPVSVVKELVENSLDAGAKQIDVHIKKSGKQLIRVSDNGGGIAKQDLALALSRHATSKINQLADLSHIASLGFRGEALASISSVAKCRLLSNCGEQAWQIAVQGDDMQAISAAAHPPGTSIEVRELFFNTPVRRKFLRSDKTEYLQIDDVMRRIALSHFEVGFSFQHDGKRVWQVSPALSLAQQEKRLQQLCGKSVIKNSRYLEQQAEGLSLRGWLACGEGSRAHTDVQYFFLNGRMLRDKLVNHAIKSAVHTQVPAGRHAAYVLYLSCDPAAVDVNVHPTKHEVRFHQPRLIHDFIQRSLQPEESTLIASSAYQIPDLQVAEARTPYLTTDLAGKKIAYLKQRYLLVEQQQALLVVDSHKLWARWLSSHEQRASQRLQPAIKLSLCTHDYQQLEKQAKTLRQWGFDWQLIGQHQLLLTHILAQLDASCWSINDLSQLLQAKQLLIALAQRLAQMDKQASSIWQAWQQTGEDINALSQRVSLA